MSYERKRVDNKETIYMETPGVYSMKYCRSHVGHITGWRRGKKLIVIVSRLPCNLAPVATAQNALNTPISLQIG
jgi:hypothetical protein